MEDNLVYPPGFVTERLYPQLGLSLSKIPHAEIPRIEQTNSIEKAVPRILRCPGLVSAKILFSTSYTSATISLPNAPVECSNK